MSIRITCPACETSANVSDELAGRRVNCKSCGQPLTVPDVDEVDAESAFGDTFSPDALPAAGTRSDAGGREAVAWETFRIGARVATWTGLLGVLGTICYALGIMGPLLMMNDPRAFGDNQAIVMAVITVLLLLGGVALAFQVAFAIAAAAVARGADITDSRKKWIGAAGMLLRIAVLVLVLMPALFFTRMGLRMGPILPAGIFTVSVLAYFAGYATFATGLGGVAGERLNRNGLRQSALWFALFELGVGGWFVVETFVVGGEMLFKGIAGAGALAGGDDNVTSLVVWVVILVVHFFWFRDLARQSVRAVEGHQKSLVGE